MFENPQATAAATLNPTAADLPFILLTDKNKYKYLKYSSSGCYKIDFKLSKYCSGNYLAYL